MTMKTHISVIALAALFAVPGLPAAAQDNSSNSTSAEQTTSASQSDQAQDQTKTWKNPNRIADIKSDNDRIRAMSVLIGQSVYDDMLSADAAASMQSDSSNSSKNDQSSSSNANESDKSSSNGAANASGNVNVVNLNDMFSGDVAKGLEQSAKDNAAEVGKLQGFVKNNKKAQDALTAKGFTQLNVVAAQYNADGSVDLYVVPEFVLND